MVQVPSQFRHYFEDYTKKKFAGDTDKVESIFRCLDIKLMNIREAQRKKHCLFEEPPADFIEKKENRN